MKIVITTQYRENYGAHNWNGEGDCPQYWKSKGGSVFVIPNISEAEVFFEENIEEIASLISYSNDFSEEYVASSTILSDDAPVCEDWETPTEISKENGIWMANCVTKNNEYSYMHPEIMEKKESYNLLPNGKRENYNVSYVLTNGQEVSQQNLISTLGKKIEIK